METAENITHRPVMAAAAVDGMLGASGGRGVFVDATFGGGGHSRETLRRLHSSGRLFALDCDEFAAEQARKINDPRFVFCRANFSDLRGALAAAGALDVNADSDPQNGGIDGALFDLGVSTPQLKSAPRGFSFQHDAPADMRLDRRGGQTAGDWLQTAGESEISRVLRDYGEEPAARRIARALRRALDAGELNFVDDNNNGGDAAQTDSMHSKNTSKTKGKRRHSPPVSTLKMAAVIAAAKGEKRARGRAAIHPATQAFQAFRIFINDELDALRSGLRAATSALREGGRLAVIAFHSLEDRIVKRHAVGQTLPGVGRVGARLRALGRAQTPSEDEVMQNPAARSARLRVFEKIAEAGP